MRIVEADGVSLAVDRFGDRHAPPLLLIAGATQSMDWWTPDFCGRLAAEGLQVVRYDQRDTGQSSMSPPGRPGYDGVDLATDPIRILDALDIDSAHLLGLSMGGGVAQYVAVHAAHRVRTLMLIESSPAGGDTGDLPGPDVTLRVAERALPEVHDWSDAAAVVDHRVETERVYAGTLGFDEERCRAIAATEVARSRAMESSFTNHFLVAADVEADPSLITRPTLVIHSDADPLFSLPHGEALARMIPGAVLFRVNGMGHEVPPPRLWDALVPVLAEHMLS